MSYSCFWLRIASQKEKSFCDQLFRFLFYLQFSKMLPESMWKKQRSILQEDADNISSLKKEINKQTEIDASVQHSISDKIQNLKQSAAVLAKKLENQKHKNSQLESIIKYLKEHMESQRLQEASFRENNSSQNLGSLQNKLKKLQYDLEQINSRTNRMAENVDEKKSKISQNRTERVIDSGIFRNIEKELANSELTFKKLLIEKVKQQKEYQKLVQEYGQLKEKAESFVTKDFLKIKPQNENTSQKQDKSIMMEALNKFKKIESRRQTKGRTLTMKWQEQINEDDEKSIIVIKKLLSRTGLRSSADLIFLFQNVNEINQKYYNEMNNSSDEMNQFERYLLKAKQMAKEKTSFQNDNREQKRSKTQLIKQRKDELKHIQTQVQKQLQQLFDFLQSQNLAKLAQEINTQLPALQQKNFINSQSFIETIQVFEKNIQQLIYCQHQKQEKKVVTKSISNELQEMMSRVRKNEEFSKVMKKQDFQEQYQKIIKNLQQKNLGTRQIMKKKPNSLVKK